MEDHECLQVFPAVYTTVIELGGVMLLFPDCFMHFVTIQSNKKILDIKGRYYLIILKKYKTFHFQMKVLVYSNNTWKAVTGLKENIWF